jgi:hypothetical protein
MSIWTELLFLHGHIATPRALALIAPAGPCAAATAATAAACPPSTAAPATPAAPAAPTAGGEPCWHPLRGAGQLP